MSKPVDLIIANSIHDALARLVEAQTQLAASIDSLGKSGLIPPDQMPTMRNLFDVPELPEEIARTLLCRIAHEAHLALVLKALGSVGGPSGIEQVKGRVRSAHEAMQREGRQ